jgi:L-seryl-tRNA(Ser) seleniumtransferase
MQENPFRGLPRVDALAASAPVAATGASPALAAEAAREVVAEARSRLARGEPGMSANELEGQTAARVNSWLEPGLVPVWNATGVLVHTNLGRSPLDPTAVAAGLGYSNLEYDLEQGARGSRATRAARLLVALSGAEAALVVNNNAAAVMLALSGLAHGREVLISRGELVEIGGSFRIPEILEASGARLREVGTTNRTYARDYERAAGPDTAAILRCHPSNFRVSGFVHAPTTAELREVATAKSLLLLHDLGSATFGTLPAGLPTDADVSAELAAGCDLVCFSGDKLLGGPQAGLLLGARAVIDRLARHPLARAVRADKLVLAALEHTLLAYRAGALDRIPLMRMLHAPLSALRDRARALASELEGVPAKLSVEACQDAIGGGSHPETTLPGAALTLTPSLIGATDLAARLRAGWPAVVAPVHDGRVWIHLRTLWDVPVQPLAEAIRCAFAPKTSP